jgi:uncharacterized membrane protein (UPF0127 family)
VPLLSVRSPDGTLRLRVEVDFARTAEARREGLAARAGLDDGRGLLLVFPTEGEVCIENAVVGFAIDALFADAAGQVIAIERGIPARDATSRCHQPVAQVLELAGGVALSVQVGDVLEQAP